MEGMTTCSSTTLYHSTTSPMTYSSSPRHTSRHNNSFSSERLSISSCSVRSEERLGTTTSSSVSGVSTRSHFHTSSCQSPSESNSSNSRSACEYKANSSVNRPVQLSYKQRFAAPKSNHKTNRRNTKKNKNSAKSTSSKGQAVNPGVEQECDRVRDEMIAPEDNLRDPLKDVLNKTSSLTEPSTDKGSTSSENHQASLLNGTQLEQGQLMRGDSSATPISNGHPSWPLSGCHSDLEEDDVFQDALSNLPSICSSTSSSAFHTPLSTRSHSPVTTIRPRLSSPHEHTPSTGSSSTLSCESSLTKICESLLKVQDDRRLFAENGGVLTGDESDGPEIEGCDQLSYCPVSFTHNSMISVCEQGVHVAKTRNNQLQNRSARNDSRNRCNEIFSMFVGDLELTINNPNDTYDNIDFSTKVDFDHDEGEDSGCSMSIGSPIKGSLDRKRPGVLHVVPHTSLAPDTNSRSGKKQQNSSSRSPSSRLQGSPIHHGSFDFSSISTASPQSSVYSHSSSPPLILSPSPTPPHHHDPDDGPASEDVVHTFVKDGPSKEFLSNDHSSEVHGGEGQEEEWPSFDGPVNISPVPAARTTMSFTNGLIYPTPTNGLPLAVQPQYPPPPMAMMTFAPNQYYPPHPVVSQSSPPMRRGGETNGTTSQQQQEEQQPSSSSSSNDHQKITSYIKTQLEMFQRLNQFHHSAAVSPPFFGGFGPLPPPLTHHHPPPPPSFRPHPTGQTGFTGIFPPQPPLSTAAMPPTSSSHGSNWTPVVPPSHHHPSPPPTLHPSPPPKSPSPAVYDDHSVTQQPLECSEVEDRVLEDEPERGQPDIEPVLELHPLGDSWVVWYDKITGRGRNKLADYKNTLNKVFTVTSVEDFWRLYNNIKPPSELTVNANYHFFKEGVDPLWEDPANKSGGQWVLTIKDGGEVMDSIWMEVLLALVGGGMTNSQLINGAVFSRRNKGNRIALWTSRKTKKTNLDICKDLLKALCYGYEGSLTNLPGFVRQLTENKHMVFGFKHHGDSLKSGHSHHTDFHITLRDHLDEILADFGSS